MIQTQRYSDWVDRGRPAPCHHLWACYLRWVSEQLAPESRILKAEVLQVSLSEEHNRWILHLADEGGTHSFFADRLMLTGPGKTRLDFLTPDQTELPPGVYDLQSFWTALKSSKLPTQGTLALVGTGENAASALLALSKYAPEIQIEMISPTGFISTRAENYYENQVYSHPERNHWKELEISDRLDFIQRTDLGVFSSHAMSILNDEARKTIIPGRVTKFRLEQGRIEVSIEYRSRVSKRTYDQVILATGSDYISSLRSLLSEQALQKLESSIGGTLHQNRVASAIQEDLSVAGLFPQLHLPMLAGLMQGPGFANLSCLGRLSDRIVASPLKKLGEFQFDELIGGQV